MKLRLAVPWILALVVAFALGRMGLAGPRPATLPLAYFQQAFEQRNPLLRSLGMSRFLRTLRSEDVPALIEFVEARQRWFDAQDLLLLMTALVEIDESHALDWALAQEDAFGRRAGGAAIEAAARRNPIEARAVVAAQRDSRLAIPWQDHLIRGWARSDFERDLTKYVSLIERKDERQRATSVLASEMTRQGIGRLAEWAESVPDEAHDGYKRVAFKEAADALGVVDPIAARRLVQSHIEEDYVLDAVPALMERWVEEARPTALHWLVTLPDFEGWEEPIPAYTQWQDTLTSLFRKWWEKTPKRAEAWLRYETPSRWADPLVRVLVRQHYLAHPGLALDWSHLIHDPETRGEIQLRVGRSWFRRSPDAFRRWLPNSGLDPLVQESILDSPPQASERGS